MGSCATSLIGAIPPVGISDWRLVAVAALAGVVTFFWHPRLERLRRSIIVLDAGALALFVLSGTMKALGVRRRPARRGLRGACSRAWGAASCATC
nr:hypothetical protein [Cellulosimicrobium sp. MM]